MTSQLLPGVVIALAVSFVSAQPIADKVNPAVGDRQDFQSPDRVRLTGWLGSRVNGNEASRLAKIDTDRLLEGYRKRPGRQAWDGEHVGKWLHAATLAWVNTGDPELRKKLDYTVTELMKCQLDDGYLGTYLEKDRWKSWDVWAHKYNLLGLLTYVRYTGDEKPMATCRRMADLLCYTFGDAPGKRDIIPAGEHVGMAPTSVLEPMVILYRMTGEQKYLDFCRYLLRSWEQQNGPKIISRLLSQKRVDKVGNAKAYEMLSCLVGALEYYRAIGGDVPILEACLIAWQDIVDKRLYLTGAASYREHFHDDFDLPNVNNVGETCVTVTWLQFNAQLLRLTGEARFAEQLERVVLNQLMGAQRPDCAAWGYYVQMEGKKPYSSTLDGHCCLSSGPRGLALVPTFASSVDADGAVINLYDAGVAKLNLRDGTAVSLTTETKYPSDGRILITVSPAAAKAFSIKLRIPAWSATSSVNVNGEKSESKTVDGYLAINRTWNAGDKVELNLKLEGRVIVGDHSNAGRLAFMYGPLVLAADEALLGDTPLNAIAVNKPEAGLTITPAAAPEKVKSWPDAQIFNIKAVIRRTGAAVDVPLIPFADAGGTGSRYKVWLPLPKAPGGSLLADGTESRSRPGNLTGSILDDDNESIVVTFDNKPAKEDWFAVSLDAPLSLRRIVFVHGRNFHDGGWFVGKPQVQVQREKGGAWQTAGELADYPTTTATSPARLKDGQAFTLKLAEPVKAVAVRVIGVPASGDNPKQTFSSCAELQAFEE